MRRDRPGSSYREQETKAYTRKEYMKGVPASRIVFHERGDPNRSFSFELSLRSEEKGQIRDQALAASQIAANRYLMKETGENNYYFKLRVYPHHILRKNPIAIGAGADRISDGMRQSFGMPRGRAARVSSGQKIFDLRIPRDHYQTGREALRRAKNKLPLPGEISLDKGENILSQ